LWTVAIPQLIAINSSLTNTANEHISANAQTMAKDIDDLLTNYRDLNTADARLPLLIKYLENENISSVEILTYLGILHGRNAYAYSYGLLDKNGKNLFDTRSDQIGKNESLTIYFKTIERDHKPSISDVVFNDIGYPVFYILSPIRDKNGSIIGFLRAEFSAKLIQDEAAKQAAAGGSDVFAIIVDKDGIILAHTFSPELRFKTISLLSKEHLAVLQQTNRLPSGNAESFNAGLSDLEKELENSQLKSQSDQYFRTALVAGSAEPDAATEKDMEILPWRVIIGQPVSTFLATATDQVRTTLFIATIVMFALLFAAGITSNLLTSPLNYLVTVAERIGRGELDVHVRVDRHDEIGLLSQTLDTTVTQLRQILQTLEKRTADLAHANENEIQHTNQLHAIAEIVRSVTLIQNLDQLLPEITRLISKAFGFYHVGIFLIDPSNRYAVLQASNSEGGQAMLARNHRLTIGETGIVALVTSTGQPRIFNAGSEEDNIFFNNPDLPNTQSEIALPLRIGENIIGALDLQSTESFAFSTESIDTFSLLADQISIAIQNNRLFDETRTALVESEVFYQQSAVAGWRKFLGQGMTGYRYINGRIEAVNEGSIKTNSSTKSVNADFETLSIPINIRGKTLGTLDIHQAGRNLPWGETEIRTFQSIMDRLSFALENARLYSDAQKRASKERAISEISTKIRSTNDPNEMIRVAINELKQALNIKDVRIIPYNPPKNGDGNKEE
jgi:GAF domain-containing protein/HAMP domain-containing protein